MEGLELVSFKIISAVGMAKSSYMEAMMAAQKNDFEAAQEKIKEGEQFYIGGHNAHAELIQKEASGEGVNPTLLLIHAEDQLMAAETTKVMANEIIALCQRLYALEKK